MSQKQILLPLVRHYQLPADPQVTLHETEKPPPLSLAQTEDLGEKRKKDIGIILSHCLH